MTIYPVLPLAYKTHPSHSLSATNIAHTRSYKQPLCVDYIDSHSLQKRHDNTLYTINCCHIPIYSTLRDSRRFPLGHSTLYTCFSLIHTDKNMNLLLFHETPNVHHQCYTFSCQSTLQLNHTRLSIQPESPYDLSQADHTHAPIITATFPSGILSIYHRDTVWYHLAVLRLQLSCVEFLQTLVKISRTYLSQIKMLLIPLAGL